MQQGLRVVHALLAVPAVEAHFAGGCVHALFHAADVAAGTPADAIAKLNAAAAKAAHSPDFVKKVEHEGLVITAGTPADVIAKLNAAAKKAAASPDFAKTIEQEGLSIVASDPAELDRYVKAEEARWRKIVKENNIKSE